MADSINIFAQAARRKLRFQFNGPLSVEELFDLTREQLDQLYRVLSADQPRGEGLISRQASPIVELKRSIVGEIFVIKTAEAADRANRAASKAKRARIMELVAEKQDGALQTKSLEELTAMLKDEEAQDAADAEEAGVVLEDDC